MTLVFLSLGIGPASANEYGNPDYLGIAKASPPQGFPVSPAYTDISHGPVTVTHSVTATNLTSSDQTTEIGFSMHHILTFEGQDVSDGQPGQPGISFPPGNVKLVTEELTGARQTAPLTMPAGGQGTVSFNQVMSSCGYYEIDFSTPTTPYTYLAVGFTRVLGCNSAATTTTLPGGTTTTVSVLASTTSIPATTSTSAGSQVLGNTVSGSGSGTGSGVSPAGTLPVTGSNPWVLVRLAGFCLLFGGAFMAAAARKPKRA